MAVLASAVQAASQRVPRFVSLDGHRTVDYILAGTLIAGGAAFWHKDRKASVASFVCGGALIGLNLATRYPSNRRAPLALVHHREAERALAGLLASIPAVFRMEKNVGRYFSAHSIALGVLDNLTSFSPVRSSRTHAR